MIGTVTRVDADGAYVQVPSVLPGVELGPLPGIVHRTSVAPEAFTTYKAGDAVMVVEDTPNDFIVIGIVSTSVEPPS